MLTVKQLAGNGFEYIVTCHRIRVIDEPEGGVHVYCDDEKFNRIDVFNAGLIFVMNPTGSTVAKYDLRSYEERVPSAPKEKATKYDG